MVGIAERQRIPGLLNVAMSSRVVLNWPISGYCLLAISSLIKSLAVETLLIDKPVGST
jgi:hypothetical protein